MEGVRLVVITIDTLMDLIKDYTSDLGDLPDDAKPVKLMIKPSEQGKFGIVVDSDSWASDLPPLNVNFEIKRIHGVN